MILAVIRNPRSCEKKATGEVDVEFKFQRRCCKLSFLFPPCSQSSPESLLASYLELSLFQAPKCVPFSFASFPLSESLEQATLNLRQWCVEGKILPVTVLDPFVVVSFKSLLFCNYGQTISCQKGERVREESQIVLARIVVATWFWKSIERKFLAYTTNKNTHTGINTEACCR